MRQTPATRIGAEGRMNPLSFELQVVLPSGHGTTLKALGPVGRSQGEGPHRTGENEAMSILFQPGIATDFRNRSVGPHFSGVDRIERHQSIWCLDVFRETGPSGSDWTCMESHPPPSWTWGFNPSCRVARQHWTTGTTGRCYRTGGYEM